MTIRARRRFGRSALLVWGAALVLALSAGMCGEATAPRYVSPEEEDQNKKPDDTGPVGFLLLPDGGSLPV
jgi:hypothetical protein